MKSNGRAQACVAKVLLLFQRFVRKESKGKELPTVLYMECVLSLDGVKDALKCSCLQRVTASSAKEEHGVGEEGETGMLWRQLNALELPYSRAL